MGVSIFHFDVTVDCDVCWLRLKRGPKRVNFKPKWLVCCLWRVTERSFNLVADCINPNELVILVINLICEYKTPLLTPQRLG